MIAHCKTHGETEFFNRPDGGKRCKKCNTAAVTKRRREVKRKLVEYAGGSCRLCGYNQCQDAMEFHHRNPKEKDFNVNRSTASSFERCKAEVDKCLLVCSNCHREIHAGVHGRLTER